MKVDLDQQTNRTIEPAREHKVDKIDCEIKIKIKSSKTEKNEYSLVRSKSTLKLPLRDEPSRGDAARAKRASKLSTARPEAVPAVATSEFPLLGAAHGRLAVGGCRVQCCGVLCNALQSLTCTLLLGEQVGQHA